MKVRATQLGYYDHVRRREGDVFTLKEYKDAEGKVVAVDQQFSKRWMEKVDDDTPERYSTSQQEIKRLSEERRSGGDSLRDQNRESNRPSARHDAGMSESTKEQARHDAQHQRETRQGGKSTGDRDVT